MQGLNTKQASMQHTGSTQQNKGRTAEEAVQERSGSTQQNNGRSAEEAVQDLGSNHWRRRSLKLFESLGLGVTHAPPPLTQV